MIETTVVKAGDSGVDPGAEESAPDAGRRVMQFAVGAVAGIVVLFATRQDPVLSPDSITYLSAAESLRNLDGVADFTGEPLAHFPPVFPILLAPGGRSLVWASIVGAACAAAIAALLFSLLASRVRPSLALAGASAYALSQAVVRIESTVWSETPYLVCALATMKVLDRRDLTVRRSAVAGGFAGLGFLTRYAGAGLVVTGLVMVIVAASVLPAARRRRYVLAYLAPPAILGTAWIARNMVATGEPFGPHFEGGANDSIGLLFRLQARALGRLVLDLDTVNDWTKPAGFAVLIGLVIAMIVSAVRRPWNVLNIGMAAFAFTSVVLPTVSRVITGTHIEARIASPTFVAVVYFVFVAFDAVVRRTRHRRAALGIGAIALIAWCVDGVGAAIGVPDRLSQSAGHSGQPTTLLYERIPDPDQVNLLTNSPHRFWWGTEHVPTLFGFTEPEPGNSHFPLTAGETLRRACAADTYLAWFPDLANAQQSTPEELRPDLAEIVHLTEVAVEPGGTLYRLDVLDPAACRVVPPSG